MSNPQNKLFKVQKETLLQFQKRVNKVNLKHKHKFKIVNSKKQKNNYSSPNNVLLVIINKEVQSRNINYDFNVLIFIKIIIKNPIIKCKFVNEFPMYNF